MCMLCGSSKVISLFYVDSNTLDILDPQLPERTFKMKKDDKWSDIGHTLKLPEQKWLKDTDSEQCWKSKPENILKLPQITHTRVACLFPYFPTILVWYQRFCWLIEFQVKFWIDYHRSVSKSVIANQTWLPLIGRLSLNFSMTSYQTAQFGDLHST